MCMRASELRKFWHFTFLNCYFFQYFVIINAFSFYHLWYDAIYKRQYTDKTLTLRKCMYMYMRASGASELRKFWHFRILKLLFPSIFLLVLHILCLRNIFNFRQWRNEPKHLGAQSLRGSVATERGEGVGWGCPPSHGRELFHFST